MAVLTCVKRIDSNAVAIVQYSGKLARVLLNSEGKRVDFPTFAKAKGKIWHIESAKAKFHWTPWYLKVTMDEQINARLDRALAKELALVESSQEEDDDDRGERNMLAREYYRNMANELAHEPEFLDGSEEDFDIDDAVEAEQDRHFDACFGANYNEPQPEIGVLL